jgi:hypothetical protein
MHAGFLLQHADHLGQIGRGRIAARAEHAHQAFDGVPVAVASFSKPMVALKDSQLSERTGREEMSYTVATQV